MVYATLSNPNRPGSPAVTVGFPITENVYADLESIGIGSATERDCYAASVGGDVPIIKRLEKTAVNVDELDYLVKRLDSFDRRELAQFQGVAVSRGYFDMTDLINLTFCCQNATVVQDFSDLASIGRAHYLDIHGGAMPEELQSVDARKLALSLLLNLASIGRAHYLDIHGGAMPEELQSVDARKLALSLLLNEDGKVTPYGVVYDNGMQLEQLYGGQHFPDYLYSGNTVLTVAMTDRRLSEDAAPITWLHFPINDWQIERSVIRTGISVPEDMRLRYSDSELPQELTALLGGENLHDVNDLCAGFAELDQGDRQKLGAVLQMAQPDDLVQARNLLKQLDLFDFIPKVSTPAEYGRYMIAESGRFEYDENLDEFYDYQKYGKQRMSQEQGQYVGGGYVSYHGFISIEEVLAGSETERMEQTLGGM